jgi:hypothetical protein
MNIDLFMEAVSNKYLSKYIWSVIDISASAIDKYNFFAFILNLKSHFPPITVILILLFDALIRKAQSSFPQEEPFYSLSLLRFTFTWSCDVKVIFSLQLLHYWLARITVELYEATSRVLVKESSENDSTNLFFWFKVQHSSL